MKNEPILNGVECYIDGLTDNEILSLASYYIYEKEGFYYMDGDKQVRMLMIHKDKLHSNRVEFWKDLFKDMKGNKVYQDVVDEVEFACNWVKALNVKAGFSTIKYDVEFLNELIEVQELSTSRQAAVEYKRSQGQYDTIGEQYIFVSDYH